MKISEVLREAKPYLKKERFVCWAIKCCDAPYGDKERARQYIAKLIYPHNAVNYWLASKGISEKALTLKNNLLYRERWIDHMISELERKGR